MFRLKGFSVLFVLLFVFTSCNDDFKDVSELSGPALSSTGAEVDLGYTWEVNYYEGNRTWKEVHTTATLWDGTSELLNNVIYRLDFDQAERVYAGCPEMLRAIKELQRADLEVQPKTKSPYSDIPQLAYTIDQDHYADATVDCYYDPNTNPHCRANAWLNTGVEAPGYEGWKTCSHMAYNVTLGFYIDALQFRSYSPVPFYWSSHIYNYTTYQCNYTIRGQAQIVNPGAGIFVSETDEDDGN